MNELKSLKKQNRKTIRFEGHFLRKYKCLNQLHRDLKIVYVRRNTKSKLLSTMQKEKVNIRDFFLRPDNSRILSGMKKTVTLKKIKKRLLKDSICNLYRKYVAETTSNISFTCFWRSKPFSLDSHQKVKETHVCANHVTTSNCWLRDFLISIL